MYFWVLFQKGRRTPPTSLYLCVVIIMVMRVTSAHPPTHHIYRMSHCLQTSHSLTSHTLASWDSNKTPSSPLFILLLYISPFSLPLFLSVCLSLSLTHKFSLSFQFSQTILIAIVIASFYFCLLLLFSILLSIIIFVFLSVFLYSFLSFFLIWSFSILK